MYKVKISELKALKEALIQSNDLLTKISKNSMTHSKIRRELKLIIEKNEIQINEISTNFYV